MLDFTNCKELLNDYSGSEKKKKIILDNEIYLLKFPDPRREKNGALSYINNQFSEYVGCHIISTLGIEAQQTELGLYRQNGKEKICVACRDFQNDGYKLYEFSKLANSITNSDKKFSVNIEDVYEVIARCDLIKDKQSIIDGFWDIFVCDCLIGNPDRHLDNWGIVENSTGEVRISPVYDCGSCLFPLLSEDKAKDLLDNPTELKNASYNTQSIYKINGKRIAYRDISKIDNKDFKKSLYRVGTQIDFNRIREVIEHTPYMSDIYKEVFLNSIEIRYKLIMKKEIEKVTVN